ncbi:galectin-3b isoform X2 [Acanthochromis polyacanthus]|nr:galectin-3b isoform X2 [Acanthochromis polyacanthus]
MWSGENPSGPRGSGSNPAPVWQGGSGSNPAPVWPEGSGSNPAPVWQGGSGSNPAPVWPEGSGSNPAPVWQGGSNPGPVWPGGSAAPQPSAPGGWPHPSPGPGPGQNLTVPYNQMLPNGVFDKLLITVAGTVKPNADKFTLDFNTSVGDLAFHFNPRFNDQGKKAIVRNSCIGKKWGKEEREMPNFPFVQGQPFEIKILCTNTAFKVAVNNSHLLEYRHRIMDLRNINRLNIYNDITLSNFKMETLP